MKLTTLFITYIDLLLSWENPVNLIRNTFILFECFRCHYNKLDETPIFINNFLLSKSKPTIFTQIFYTILSILEKKHNQANIILQQITHFKIDFLNFKEIKNITNVFMCIPQLLYYIKCT